MSLIPLNEDVEGQTGLAGDSDTITTNSRIPPEWVSVVDEIQYEMTRFVLDVFLQFSSQINLYFGWCLLSVVCAEKSQS